MSNFERGPSSGYTGHLFERTLLDSFVTDWDGEKFQILDREEKNKMINDWLLKYVPEVDTKKDYWRKTKEEQKDFLVAWAKTHQPKDWNPSNPFRYSDRETENGEKRIENRIIADLHYSMAELFGLLDDEDKKKLKVYTAIDTPADTLSGVDAIFEYEGVDFTVDFTINKQKREEGVLIEKADIVVLDEEVEGETLAENDERIQATAKIITRAFKHKLRMMKIRQDKSRVA